MAELRRRPSVTVEQVIRSQIPTVAASTLVACVVGPCYQVVDAQIEDANGKPQINASARVDLPASIQSINGTGSPPVYALSDKDSFVFAVTNKPPVDVRFPSTGDYTPDQVVTQILAAMESIEETDAVVDVVGNDPVSGDAFRLRTLGRSIDDTIEIDPEGRSAAKVIGTVDLTTLTYPGDVAGLTIQVSVDEGTPQTITLASPVSASAMVTAISVLTGATAAAEATTNYLSIASDLVGSPSKIEVVGGTLLAVVGITAGAVDAGTGSTQAALDAFGFVTTDLEFGASQYAGYELVVPPKSFPDLRDNIDQLVMDADSVRVFLSTSGGAALQEVSRKSAMLRSATAAVTVVDDGNGDNRSPFLNLAGQNLLNPVAAVAQITGSAAPTFASLSNKTVLLSDGRAPRLVSFGTVSDIVGVVAAINAVFDVTNGLIASSSGGNLRLTSTRLREDGLTLCKGEDSQIVLLGGTGLEFLDSGGTPVLVAGRTTGAPHKVLVGDELYVDGARIGKVVQVAPSGVTTRVKVDVQKDLAFTGSNFYFRANNLKGLNDGGAVDRPAPDLIVESDGQVLLKPGILRNTLGKVVESVQSSTLYPGRAPLYVAFRGLRLDVTAEAGTGLLGFPSTELVEDELSPVNSTNPLALGAYLALLNAPGVSVTALGLSATSPDQPQGTVAAHAQAASYLEQFEVYGIAPLTHDDAAFDIWASHVTEMSKPERKRERIVLVNPARPTFGLDSLIASGATGNTVGNTGLTFDTGLASLPQLVLEAGLNPAATIPASAGLYLDVGTDAKRYNISAISGSVVTVRTTFAPGQNDDSYYATSAIEDVPLIDVAFGVRLRGDKLVLTSGKPDKDAIADTYMQIGQGFSNRRVWVTAPDACVAVLGGVEQEIPGYFINACLVGMISRLSPSQSFTNLGVAGIKRVKGSQGYFTEDQMDHIAYGGVTLLIQDNASSPVAIREMITSDTTSDATSTDIVTKSLDFVAKYQRSVLKGILGKNNVSEGLIDTINLTIQGTVDFLVGNSIVENIRLLSAKRDPNNKLGVVLEEEAQPFYPCNHIGITLYV